MQRFALVAAVTLTVAACQDATSPRPIAAPPATVSAAQGAASGDYIVVFKSDEADPAGQADALVRAHGGQLTHVYRSALKGFAVANLPDAALEALRRNPRIDFIEPDGIMTATADVTQSPVPSWGIDRIDARSGRDNSYTYPNTASNVTAYIIDTGINPAHCRSVGPHPDAASITSTAATRTTATATARTSPARSAGTAYGVAKGAKVVAVRVLNCQGSGSTSGVIAGVDWVKLNAVKPAVANMSLGGGYWAALNTAVNNAVASGVTFAVAAGNENRMPATIRQRAPRTRSRSARRRPPTRRRRTRTTATAWTFRRRDRASRRAGSASPTATATISGTSMASPHVAGAAALVLGDNAGLTPTQVRDALVNNATNGVRHGAAVGA